MTCATEMLERMKRGEHRVPLLVKTLKLGLLDDWGDGWVRKSWDPVPELLHDDGAMFGGYIAALFDQTFALAAMTALKDSEAFRTTNLTISFQSLSRSERVILDARVVARSKRLITLDGRMSSADGEVRSTASAQQMITRKT